MFDPVKEAQLLLSIADQKLRPFQYKARRAEAAKKLVKEFVGAAKGLGDLTATSTDDEKNYPKVRFGDVAVLIMADGTGLIHLALQRTVNTNEHPVEAMLDYDPNLGVLVGREVDPNIAPLPGEYRPRAPALLVLARMVSKLLEPAPNVAT
ncbi:MAG: hypothetical protein ABI548_16880 [Polyangiaceae bacterium]